MKLISKILRNTAVITGVALAMIGGGALSTPAHAQDLISSFEESQALGDRLAGKLEKQFYDSPALGKNSTRRVYIYTPPGYTGIGARTYPVLILLHGTPGDPAEWLFRGGGHKIIDNAIKSGKVAPFIAAFPDGKGPFWKYGSEWADAVNGKSNMETAVSRDLPQWLEQNYRVSHNPALWAVGGLSEGGYGAANLVVRHPDRFQTAICLSGEFTVSDDWEDAKAVFGTDPKVRAANSPILAIHHLAPAERSKLFFYLAIGADDDSDLIAQNDSFAATCKTLGVPVAIDHDRGSHQWGFWSGHLKSGLLEWNQRALASGN